MKPWEEFLLVFVVGLLVGVTMILPINAALDKRAANPIPYAQVLPCAVKGETP